MNRKSIKAITFLICFLTLAWGWPKKIRFFYKPQDKKKTTYQMVARVKAKIPGIEVQGKLTITFEEEILNIDKEGNVKEKITCRDLKVEMPVALPIMNVLKGSSVIFKLSPQGKILETTVSQERSDASPVPDSMSTGLNLARFHLNPSFPDYPVKKGDSWRQDTDNKINVVGMSIINKGYTKYTLVGFQKIDKRKCALIEIDMEIETGVKPELGIELGFSSRIVSKGTGKFFYDYKNSQLVKMEMNLNAEGEFSTEKWGRKEKTEIKEEIEITVSMANTTTKRD